MTYRKSVLQYIFVPSAGVTRFLFNGKYFDLERREAENKDGYGRQGGLEVLVISTWGRDTSVFQALLAEIEVLKDRNSVHVTYIYNAYVQGATWTLRSRGRPKRPLDSVILQDGIVERLVVGIQRFMDNPAWYKEFGVPYHRGYLLKGPPGTGKTSLISAIAANFDMSIGLLNLTDRYLDDYTINRLMANAPANKLIVLEDIDSAFGTAAASEVKAPKAADSEEEDSLDEMDSKPVGSREKKCAFNRLTFSGLLNALDGLDTAEPRILFMTTNHVEQLDAALIRPGRVDVQEHIGYATKEQMLRMFKRFKKRNGPDVDAEAEEFVNTVMDNQKKDKDGKPKDVSLALVQELLIKIHLNPSPPLPIKQMVQ